jgi:hypothetical protein
MRDPLGVSERPPFGATPIQVVYCQIRSRIPSLIRDPLDRFQPSSRFAVELANMG